jgi:hypothetical protein
MNYKIGKMYETNQRKSKTEEECLWGNREELLCHGMTTIVATTKLHDSRPQKDFIPPPSLLYGIPSFAAARNLSSELSSLISLIYLFFTSS